MRGAEERAHKTRKWRGFKIKHFPKLAFLTKFIFSEARVGDPTKPHFQELHMVGERGQRRSEETYTDRGRGTSQRMREREREREREGEYRGLQERLESWLAR